MHELLRHALYSDSNYFASGEKQKRLPGAAGGEAALGNEDDVKLTGRCYSLLQFFLYSSLSFFFAFCVFFAFFVFVSLFVFSLSNRSSVHLFSSPVRPCVSLLECPVSSAVASEDGALELLLMAKYNGLTLCFSLSFVRPLSLCVSLCSLFFSLYWFSCPWSLCFFFLFSFSLHRFFVFSGPSPHFLSIAFLWLL